MCVCVIIIITTILKYLFELACTGAVRRHLWIDLSLSISVSVKYRGRASHAAAFPWEGVNALDAAVMCYQGISNMRQQFKPSWRVNGNVVGIFSLSFFLFPFVCVSLVVVFFQRI